MKRAVLYCRVSTTGQAETGYSLPQQREALRAWCEREGYEVVAEVEDPGYSGASLERPGLDHVRDLVEAGGVSVVVAQDRDRFAREPALVYLLRRELEEHGTKMRALNDRGDESPEGELTDAIIDQLAKFERAKTAERTRRGLSRKVGEGKIIRGRRAPYGFSYAEDGNSLVVAPEMGVVCRIFRMIGAEGATLGEVIRRLTDRDVPAPSGLRADGTPYKWHRTTLRNMVKNALYRPLSAEEAAEQVPAGVARNLDPGRVYGLWTFNKKRGQNRQERAEDGGYRKRYTSEPRPREEWGLVPVDLTGSGLERGVVDAARERLAENGRRPPSTVAERFWQLSGGILRCAVCGSSLTPLTTRRWDKTNTYYRCYQRYNSGPRDCTNTNHMPAPALEQAVWEAIYGLLAHPERLERQHDEHVERMRRERRGDPDREARDLARELEKLERRRSGYIDLAADGTISREDLRVKLADLEERRKDLEEALKAAQNRHRTIEEAERSWQLAKGILFLQSLDLSLASPEDRRRIYAALRLRVELDGDRTIRLRGVFSPDMYLPSLLQDGPEWLAPIPDTKGIVVTLDNPSAAAS